MFRADQKDRQAAALDSDLLQNGAHRDRLRRERAMAMIEAGLVVTAEDHLHAALLFQHGDGPDDFLRAHELAHKAVELGHPEERMARWLVAATYDRWLTAQGRPQRYGTQF